MGKLSVGTLICSFLSTANALVNAVEPVPFEQNVWLGAYAFSTGMDTVRRIYHHEELRNPDAFRTFIEDVKTEAINAQQSGWDNRFGAVKANEAYFPSECVLNEISSSGKPCVYLFNQRGGREGTYLPLVPDDWQSTTLEKAKCIQLENESVYSGVGRSSKLFREGMKQSGRLMFNSLRLQGRVAVEMYETSDCSAERQILKGRYNINDGKWYWDNANVATHKWRFSHHVDLFYDLTDDLVVRDLQEPTYAASEPACLCPDTAGWFPPMADFMYLEYYNNLMMADLLSATWRSTGVKVTDAEKVAIIKYFVDPTDGEDIRVMAMEDILGTSFDEAKLAGSQSDMSYVKRQLYDAIFLDGPSNLQYPFPYPCSTQFTPVQMEFRSMKIVTSFNDIDYSEALCGKYMAEDSLKSILEGNSLSSVYEVAKQVNAWLEEGEEMTYTMVANSPLCIDHTDCAEAMEYGKVGGNCDKKISEIGGTKQELVGYKVKQICKKMCNACANPARTF